MATATYVKDLYRGTDFTLGVFDDKDTRSNIVGLVKHTGDTRAALLTAAMVAKNARGTVHPDATHVPLRYVTASRLGNDSAIVRLVYDNSDEALNPAFTEIVFDSGIIGIERYRFKPGHTAGNGAANLNNFERYIQNVPVVRLHYSETLTSSPLSSIIAKVGKTNNASVSVFGEPYNFPENTMRFDGHSQRIRYQNGSASYYVTTYHFTILPDTWIRYFPGTSGTTEGTAARYDTTAINFL